MRTAILLLLCAGVHAGDTKTTVRKAIHFLETTVPRLPEVGGTPRKQFVYATTGLVYLMEQETRTGKDRIRPLKDYLARYADDVERKLKSPANRPPSFGLASSEYVTQYTWSIAQTLWFFGELHARGLYRAEMKKRIPRLVGILERAQRENGGWGHAQLSGLPPKRKGKEDDPVARVLAGMGGYPSTLVSASNCVAIALGSVREIAPSDAIEKAREYYRKAQLSNGAFPYDPSQRSSGPAKTNPSRTAGSIYAMHCLGMPRDRAMEKSIDYIRREFAFLPEGHGSSSLNLFHAALCCHALGKKDWERFKEEFFGRIAEKQDKDGHLACICENRAFGATNDSKDPFGGRAPSFLGEAQRAYTTSLHTFILLLDRGTLKLHQPMKGRRVTTKGR